MAGKKFVRLAILRIRHDGTPRIPEGACREVLTTGVRSVLNFWEDTTYGYLDLKGSQMFPWFDVSITASDAIIPDPKVPGAAVITREKQAEIAVKAVRAANPDHDPLAGFDGVVVITHPGQPFVGPNPKAAEPGQPQNLNVDFDGGASSYRGFRTASIPVVPSSHTFACHEVGHVLRFEHSYGILNQGSDWNTAPDHPEDDWMPVYGSPYDIMSGETFGGSSPVYEDSTSPALSQAPGAAPQWPGPNAAWMGPALSCAYLYQQWPEAITDRAVIRDLPQPGRTGSVRLRHARSSTGTVALILRPQAGLVPIWAPGLGKAGTIVVEYRTNTSWDSGLDESGADFARVGVVVHTLTLTSEGLRPWYRGNIKRGDVDTDMTVAGTGVVISVGSFEEDPPSVNVSYRLGSSALLSIASISRTDTVKGGTVHRREKTPCGTTVRYGHWPIVADETFEVRVAGMGSEDPKQPAIVVDWAVNGKPVADGRSTVSVPGAAGKMVEITARLNAAKGHLRLTSPSGAVVKAAVTATATDFAGTTATNSAVFEAGGSVDGLHPDDYAVVGKCIADNIPGIPIDPHVFKRPSRQPQFAKDLWIPEALEQLNKLPAQGVKQEAVRNLRKLITMQSINAFK